MFLKFISKNKVAFFPRNFSSVFHPERTGFSPTSILQPRKNKILQRHEITPLFIRGTNYAHPNHAMHSNGLFRDDSRWWSEGEYQSIFDKDFKLLKDYFHINVLRIPIRPDIHTGDLGDKHGEIVTPTYLNRINILLDYAEKHGMWLIATTDFTGTQVTPSEDDYPLWQRFFEAMAQHYNNDGRFLMWELLN